MLLASCSAVITKPEQIATGIIDADDSCIQYMGRFDFSNPKEVIFDWAGVGIVAQFEGSSCSVRIRDTTDEFAIIIDQNAPKLLTTDTSENYKVASGLSPFVPHTIFIQKRTEPLVGKGIYKGFILDRGAKLLPPNKRPDRRIEFIGNSITSGYGVMSDSANCHFSPQTENAGMAFAAITARALQADYHLISFSGRGVVRNYGDANKTSFDPMPSFYDRTCCFDSTRKWDFTKWIPQVVVIDLGTNDFSTQPFPDKEIFLSAYHRLIDRVRLLYPGVTIFCVSSPMVEEPLTGYVREVVKQQQRMQGRDKDVFFIEIPRSIMAKTDWGCDMHPNIFGAKKMADLIAPMIQLRMNW
ncbi:MAG TPA: SGNH/GDSL hydrolase family protein [Bacteroidota bacterium]|nr:SGNH/GDSL hydrolase family protein [Bacteroidota bacterium]